MKPNRSELARARRTVEHMAITLEALALGTGDIRQAWIDTRQQEREIAAIRQSLSVINKFMEGLN